MVVVYMTCSPLWEGQRVTEEAIFFVDCYFVLGSL